MSDDGTEDNVSPRNARAVELRVAPLLENLTVVRTLVGAIAALADLNIDAVADLRLAIDELCTQLINCAAPGATLVVAVDPRGDELIVRASAACTSFDAMAPGSFSWYVLTSLADDVQIFRDGRERDEPGEVVGITLMTRRAGASQ